MGVHGLWNVLEPTGKPITLQSLHGKILAVDVSIWLHQAVKGFRDKDGNPLPNAHLLGVFFRVCKLLNYGIKPIFVFDGGVPVLKRQTLAARKNKKLEAQDQSEITRRKLLSNLIRTQLQKQIKQAIPPSVLIQAGINELASSSRVLRSQKKKVKRKTDDGSEDSSDENDLESMQSQLESSESINSALFSGGVKVKEAHSASSDDDDGFRGGRNYVEHFSSIKSSEFDSLPLEIQHEILFDMQESKKNNSWATVHEMPKELHDFSSFQMDRLVKRRFLQKKIQSVQKEMGNRHIHVQNLDELLDFQNESDPSAGQTEIIGSKDKGAVLIKLKPGSRKGESSCSGVSAAVPKSEPEFITIDDYVDDWPSDEGDNERSEKKVKELAVSEPNGVSPPFDFDDNDEEDAQIALAIEMSLQQTKEVEQTTQCPQLKDKTSSPRKISSSISVSSTDEELDDRLMADIDEIVERTFEEKVKEEQESKGPPMQQKGKEPDERPSVSPKKKNAPRDNVASVLRVAGSIGSACNKFFDNIGLFEVPEKVPDSSEVSSGSTSSNVAAAAGESFPESKVENNSESSTDDDEFEEVPCEPSITPAAPVLNSVEKSQPSQKRSMVAITINQNMKYEKEKDIFSDLFEDTKPADTASPDSADIVYETNPSRNEPGREGRDTKFESLPARENEDTSPVMEPDPIAGGKEPFEPERKLSMEFMQNQERLNTEQRKLHDVMGQQDRIATSITDQMYIETQELLSLFGVPYIVSPMEAESQCAFLDTACLTDGTVTDDSDIFLFGGKRVFKNFFSSGERPVEFYQYSDIVQDLNLDREKLVLLAILVGSDYTNGVEGVGPITGLEILAEFPPTGASTFGSLVQFRDWWQEAQQQKNDPINKIRSKLKQLHLRSGFPSKAVYDEYMDPTVDTSMERFRWGTLDREGIKSFTKSKFGWSESKCESNLLPLLKSMESREKQLTLDSFVTVRPLVIGKQKIQSKRLANAMKKIKRSVDVGELVDEVALSSSDSSESAEEPIGSRKGKRKLATPGTSSGRGSRKSANENPKPQPVAKVRIPKPVQEIPQKVQETSRRQQNKQRAIEILKNKK